ncbi:MAG: hypothetical protein US49_C0001G0023 [candidate division TM6 bacterium GW2011_GWF2_37_49]|nr:MAG: hypothetical protein US49_C0001G0023 [candidate division TM6 bacterium GW2011_GWF2_37_49]
MGIFNRTNLLASLLLLFLNFLDLGADPTDDLVTALEAANFKTARQILKDNPNLNPDDVNKRLEEGFKKWKPELMEKAHDSCKESAELQAHKIFHPYLNFDPRGEDAKIAQKLVDCLHQTSAIRMWAQYGIKPSKIRNQLSADDVIQRSMSEGRLVPDTSFIAKTCGINLDRDISIFVSIDTDHKIAMEYIKLSAIYAAHMAPWYKKITLFFRGWLSNGRVREALRRVMYSFSWVELLEDDLKATFKNSYASAIKNPAGIPKTTSDLKNWPQAEK